MSDTGKGEIKIGGHAGESHEGIATPTPPRAGRGGPGARAEGGWAPSGRSPPRGKPAPRAAPPREE
ncbi:paREP13 [Pyrobaculum aerophilum str. IM2]|uniref:PaREP13 n=1 Tax=Pyrobaculum aerophilum (strain ATCC 51768 / DSM 7523 / JCM 9630 / CIP 104966 / NBRC 100827 / IM2) TaxID=178306 RepID=Q8ZV17_PYRAE|nr:paREP13 [Pyrobaculum aerophilum str. IM2]